MYHLFLDELNVSCKTLHNFHIICCVFPRLLFANGKYPPVHIASWKMNYEWDYYSLLEKNMRICSTCYWRRLVGTWWIFKDFSRWNRWNPKSLKSLTALGHFLVALRQGEGIGIHPRMIRWTFSAWRERWWNERLKMTGRRSKWFAKGSPVSHADELGLLLWTGSFFMNSVFFLMFLKGKTSIHKVRYLFCDSQMNSFEVSSIHSWNFNTTAIKACMQQLGSFSTPDALCPVVWLYVSSKGGLPVNT